MYFVSIPSGKLTFIDTNNFLFFVLGKVEIKIIPVQNNCQYENLRKVK